MDSQRFRDVLHRAEEIQAQRSIQVESTQELASLVDAAVEAGLSREAVSQALQERLALDAVAHQVGELVFALSTDGFLYPARIRAIEGEVVDVGFLNGSQHRLMKRDIQPFSLLPGSTVNAPWPGWGAWNCKVVSFDRENLSVRLSDGWGTEQTFAVADVRINRPAEPGSLRERAEYWAHYAMYVAGGGAIGALVTFLIMRR